MVAYSGSRGVGRMVTGGETGEASWVNEMVCAEIQQRESITTVLEETGLIVTTQDIVDGHQCWNTGLEMIKFWEIWDAILRSLAFFSPQ